MPVAKEKLLDVNMRQKISYAAFSYRDCFVAPLLAMNGLRLSLRAQRSDLYANEALHPGLATGNS